MSLASRPHAPRGFTLVEMLVAMLVASLLASMVLVALWGAQETAREARTRAQVTKIHQLLLDEWEEYPGRKMSIQFASSLPSHEIPARIKMTARLGALRDTMRMEMPDRMTDLMDDKVTMVFTAPQVTCTLTTEPRAWRAYRRRALAILGASSPNVPDWSKWSIENQHAECLYLILSVARDDDSNALDYFQPSEIGDVDGDLMPEILDAWGHPINFLRWAPGFVSDVQPLDPSQPPPAGAQPRPADHLDPLKLDPRWTDATAIVKPFLLVPLIYSGGADEEYGLITDNSTSGSNGPFRYQSKLNDPYAPLDDSTASNKIYIGALDPNAVFSTGGHAAEDNITNHYVEVR